MNGIIKLAPRPTKVLGTMSTISKGVNPRRLPSLSLVKGLLSDVRSDVCTLKVTIIMPKEAHKTPVHIIPL